jgi:hypothetical protein
MISLGVLTMAKTGAPFARRRAAVRPDETTCSWAWPSASYHRCHRGARDGGRVTPLAPCRSTLAAIPHRRLLLVAKAAMFGGVALVVGEIVAVITFFAGRVALTDAVRP